MGYRFPFETMKQLLADNRILFGKDETKIIELKLYVQDYKAKLPSVIELDTRLGANELRTMFPQEKRIFGFTKPSELVADLIGFAVSKDDLILDSFAGSGTTGHAVLQLNRQDGGNRRFILVEMEPEISQNITAERLRRVIAGYGDTPGLGGGFRYCRLGEPLFEANGQIRDRVTFGDLARHVYFTETGEPLPKPASGRTPFLGALNGIGYYLLWSKTSGMGVLDRAAVKKLNGRGGPKVVYADLCRLSPAQLRANGITFKQIPYEIKAG